jgi:hypothetical protein
MTLHYQLYSSVAQKQALVMSDIAQGNQLFIDPLGGIHEAQGTFANHHPPQPSQSSPQSVPLHAPLSCLPSDQPYMPMPKTSWMISLFGQLGIMLHQNLD